MQKEIELNAELASALAAKGELFIKLNAYDKAITFCEEGLTISKKTGNLDSEKSNCNCLSLAYEKKGNPILALKFYKKYIQLKDSLINDEKTREATRKEMSFGFSKKQLKDSLEHSQQQKIIKLQLSEREATIKSEKAQKNGLYIGLTLLFLLGIIAYRSYRIKKKDNDLIAKQKKEVEIQKQIVERQKHVVEEKQKEIIDSINYASRIQKAILTNEKYIERILKDLKKSSVILS